MARLCERPGCSAPASVTYGFEAKRSVVWLGVLDDEIDRRHLVGVLCRRHADALTPPRGWWLDDRRVAVPTLFQVAGARPDDDAADTDVVPPPVIPDALPRGDHDDPPIGSPSRRKRRVSDDTQELAFDFETAGAGSPVSTPEQAASASEPSPSAPSVGQHEPSAQAHHDLPDPDETKAMAWTPVFDRTDDLGGVLSARSPLLSRAFGLDRRPR